MVAGDRFPFILPQVWVPTTKFQRQQIYNVNHNAGLSYFVINVAFKLWWHNLKHKRDNSLGLLKLSSLSDNKWQMHCLSAQANWNKATEHPKSGLMVPVWVWFAFTKNKASWDWHCSMLFHSYRSYFIVIWGHFATRMCNVGRKKTKPNSKIT